MLYGKSQIHIQYDQPSSMMLLIFQFEYWYFFKHKATTIQSPLITISSIFKASPLSYVVSVDQCIVERIDSQKFGAKKEGLLNFPKSTSLKMAAIAYHCANEK